MYKSRTYLLMAQGAVIVMLVGLALASMFATAVAPVPPPPVIVHGSVGKLRLIFSRCGAAETAGRSRPAR